MTEGDVEVIFFTLKILILSGTAVTVLGTLMGVYFVFGKNRRVCRSLDILFSLPLVFPPIGMGFFLISFLGRNSLLGQILHVFFNWDIMFSTTGVFIASFAAGLPLMIKSVQSSARSLNRSVLEMASLQGAGGIQKVVHIIIPSIRSGIWAGCTLSAGRSLGEVGMTLMLGGNITGRTETISLAIFNAVFEGNFHKAAGLSFLLAFLSIFLFVLIQKIGEDEMSYTYKIRS